MRRGFTKLIFSIILFPPPLNRSPSGCVQHVVRLLLYIFLIQYFHLYRSEYPTATRVRFSPARHVKGPEITL